MTTDEKTEAMEASEERFGRARNTRRRLQKVRSHLMGATYTGTKTVKQMLRGPYRLVEGDGITDAKGLLEWIIDVEAVAETEASEAYEQTKAAEDRKAAQQAVGATMRKQDEEMRRKQHDCTRGPG